MGPVAPYNLARIELGEQQGYQFVLVDQLPAQLVGKVGPYRLAAWATGPGVELI